MERFTEWLKYGDDTVKALGVSAGGLIGVFATLGVFFLVIWLSDKVGRKAE
ncbi:MAG: hypothetical protein JXA15_01855 [Spirochaetales bacterium]|nr:hypothetical protein [Spirochaetales bacterium]